MHRYFADWYRLAKLQTNSEELERRWQGVESLVDDADYRIALELVRVFYDRPLKHDTSLDKLQSTFKEADQAFPIRNNELELRVLAGASIVHVLEQQPDKKTDAAALATLCGYCHSLRSEVLLPDVIEYARDYVTNESVRMRSLGVAPKSEIPGKEIKDALTELKAACTGSNLTTIAEPVIAPFEALTTAVTQLTKATNDGMEVLTNNLKIQQEETNMLWWVFGEHSRDLKRRMSILPFPGGCLIAGKELADLTKIVPGPRTAVALLDKMLRTSYPEMRGETTINEALSALPVEWVELVIGEGAYLEVDDLCPVRTALYKLSEVGDGWASVFRRATGINVDQPLSPLELAFQMYEEQILCHTVGQ